MVPGNEFLRVFGTDLLGQVAAYTYISENYLIDMKELYEDQDPDVSEYAWAIGWWKNEPGTSYSKIIKKGPSDADAIRLRITEDITFPNGTGFVGNFTKGHAIDIVTQGGVAIETFAFENNGAHCPIFVNQLPVDITLQDISVPGYRKWGKGEWAELEFLVPGNEFFREFGVESVGQVAAYTYISENYLIDMEELYEDEEPDVSKHAWAIGWWKYEPGTSYSKIIKKGQSDADAIRLRVTEPITVKAGRGFVGNFTKGHNIQVYFPGATSVPSKQK